MLRRGGFLPGPSRSQASSEARSIVHHSHTGRSAWGNAPPASDIPLALGGACGAFQRHSPPCSPRLTDRANARRGRVSLRGRDRIRRARGSRAWAAAKSTLARRRRPARVPTGRKCSRSSQSAALKPARPRAHPPALGSTVETAARVSRLCCARVCGGALSGPGLSGPSGRKGHCQLAVLFPAESPAATSAQDRGVPDRPLRSYTRDRPHMRAASVDAAPWSAHWAVSH